MRIASLPALAVILLASLGSAVCADDPSDLRPAAWRTFVEHAADEHGVFGRRAASFLADHAPSRDADLDVELLLENLDYALRARREFPWAADVPEAIFLNDVLPYASLDETRESWRPAMYARCAPLVRACTSLADAAQTLNRTLFNEINVHYNTGRKKPNQSPAESIAQGRATCTGLSIILVDACRAVGVPARVAGVASWHDKRGNHTWVEIWDGERWRFTGADEYRPELDRAWFTGDASKAVPGDPRYGVWATSWRRTGRHFPMAWNPRDRSVPAVDSSHLYVPDAPAPAAAAVVRHVRLRARPDAERIVAAVRAMDDAGNEIAADVTRAGTADLNDMATLALPVDTPIRLEIIRDDDVRFFALAPARAGTETLDLHWNELGLSRSAAEAAVEARAATHRRRLRDEHGDALADGAITIGDHTLRVLEKTFGTAPDGERSLWISMHGGGGAPTRVNDQQWRNQIDLYEPEEGLYIAPRAPTDAWNLWHQAHIDPLFDRLIELCVATRGVDPNRVYLMGYSAGGDGVYQLAPRMADRFAAAAMMAGHPNETSPIGLRNLPFAIFMGGQDDAYNRNRTAEQWKKQLAALQAEDPDGYPHRVTIYPDAGHWMNRQDREALPWMAAQTRTPWPKRIVWRQDDVTHRRFYWLAVDAPTPRSTIVATVNDQAIAIQSDDVSRVTLRLRDDLLDLDRPITVTMNGDVVFKGFVLRTSAAVEQSLTERVDPATAATAMLTVGE